jgi:hypothetical protein
VDGCGPAYRQDSAKQRRSARADTRHIREPAIVGSRLQALRRVDIKRLVNAAGELGADPGDRLEKLLRSHRTAQWFELGPAAGPHHLGYAAGEPCSDARQGIQARSSLTLKECCESVRKCRHCLRRTPVGGDAERVRLLSFEEVGHLA